MYPFMFYVHVFYLYSAREHCGLALYKLINYYYYLDISNRSETWQAYRQQRSRAAVKFQSDANIITSNLAASRFHDILR